MIGTEYYTEFTITFRISYKDCILFESFSPFRISDSDCLIVFSRKKILSKIIADFSGLTEFSGLADFRNLRQADRTADCPRCHTVGNSTNKNT